MMEGGRTRSTDVRMERSFKHIIAIVFFVVLVYAYRAPLQNGLERLSRVYLPCERPITYGVAAFDARFDITKADFLSAIREAEALWEKPIGKELFGESTDGTVKISLVYDYRQEATEKLRSLGLAIDGTRASYDVLKAKYDFLRAGFDAKKSAYEAVVEAFTQKQEAYNKEVARLNARGGAKRAEYDRLVALQGSFASDIEKIRRMEDDLNADIEEMNALVVVLNRQATALNLNVGEYNEVGASRGREFDEGIYRSGPEGAAIDIYQFDNRAKLVQVLAHELGHALGLEHLGDPEAIMYRLNQGENKKLSASDIVSLKTLCGIKEEG